MISDCLLILVTINDGICVCCFKDNYLSSVNQRFCLGRKGQNRTRRRCALYMRNTINYKVIDTLPQHSLELLCIEVIPKRSKPFFVVRWYRPPDFTADKFQDLENVISSLETFQEIIFLGDTKCNFFGRNSCASEPVKHMRSFYDSWV